MSDLIDHSVLQFDHVVDSLSGDLGEDSVFVLEIRCRRQSEEELRTVVILASVRHRHQTSPVEPQPRMDFILQVFDQSNFHKLTESSLTHSNLILLLQNMLECPNNVWGKSFRVWGN